MNTLSSAERFAAVRKRFEEVVAHATKLYNLPKPIRLQFNLTGRVAGWAIARGGNHLVRLNSEMITGNGYESILEDTIPHEIAHVVCQQLPHMGKNHDDGWRRISVALGSTGDRTHKEKVLYKGGMDYITTTGKRVSVSGIIHKRIQAGQGRKHRDPSMGEINRECRCCPQGGVMPDAAPDVTALPPVQRVGWDYMSNTGKILTVSNIIHRKIQAGNSYRLKADGSTVDRYSRFCAAGGKMPEIPPNGRKIAEVGYRPNEMTNAMLHDAAEAEMRRRRGNVPLSPDIEAAMKILRKAFGK